ncbi:MAG TPA: enoyl-CoA hydratase [Burkholderiales bacterium]|nr:enoyl-CoA hydratase [Burkholderiales bacterium]
MSAGVEFRVAGRVAFVQLARLDKKNALTGEMYGALADAVAAAEGDAQVRAVLLHGAPDCFCAGNDVGDFLKRPPLAEGSPSQRFFKEMLEAKKPIVAAVGGPAVGIGTTMLLHCDLVYAASNARFQLPFVPLGIVPEFGSTYILPLLAGYQRAAELLLLGQPFTAEKAKEVGIVTDVCSSEELLQKATRSAEALAALPPESIRLTKGLMKKHHAATVRETIAEEIKVFGERLQSAEAKEAMSAFLEKRKPDFSRF